MFGLTQLMMRSIEGGGRRGNRRFLCCYREYSIPAFPLTNDSTLYRSSKTVILYV